MSELKTNYKNSKHYAETIISDVSNLLAKENIDHILKNNKREIVVTSNGKTVSEIRDLLYSKLKIPKNTISLLLDVVSVSDLIYIRQNTK